MERDGSGSPVEQPEAGPQEDQNREIDRPVVLNVIEEAPDLPEKPSDDPSTNDLDGKEAVPIIKDETQAEEMVRLALERGELFLSDDGQAFISIWDGKVVNTIGVNSHGARLWLTILLRRESGKVPSRSAVSSAIDALEAEARHGDVRHPVHLRYAFHEDCIYIDLGNDRFEQVRIDAKRWDIVPSTESPVRFIHRKGMRAMPRPATPAPGAFGLLRELLNVEGDTDFNLLVAWVVGSMNPKGPFPILALVGEHGTAKSTMAKILKDLVDPSTIPVVTLPRNERNLAIAAQATWMLGFNNLSGLSAEMSDSFCRLATDGGLRTRTLYTDDDEKLFTARRPLILNGISDFVTRDDLASRSIIINLPVISKDDRISEKVLWRRWEAVKPMIFGALCTALSHAIRHMDQVELDFLPRMADFAEFVVAAEPALPWTEGSFLKVYEENQNRLIDIALEADPVATAIARLIEKQEGNEWTGKASELLTALEGLVAEQTRKLKTWPKLPNALSNRIRRCSSFLRTKGIEVERGKSGDRYICIRRSPETAAAPMQPA